MFNYLDPLGESVIPYAPPGMPAGPGSPVPGSPMGGAPGVDVQAITSDPAARDAFAQKLAGFGDPRVLMALSQGLGQAGQGSGGMQIPQVGTPQAIGPSAPPGGNALLEALVQSMGQGSGNQNVLGQLIGGAPRAGLR